MLSRLSYKRTGVETLKPAKKPKISYECLRDYNFVKRNSWRLDFIPIYKKLEQAPKFEQTKKAISYMANSNAFANTSESSKDPILGLNCLVLDRLLKTSNFNIAKQKNIQNFNRLSESLSILSKVDENDIKNLTIKQRYTSKNLASDVYNTIKHLAPAQQDELLNSFNMYLIDDGTGKACADDKIDKSHLTVFGYPKNHSSMDIPVDSPLMNNIFAIEQYNQRFNKIYNLEIGTENENLNACIRSIIDTYPELITMFDTSLKQQKGIETLKNILLSLKALFQDDLFTGLDTDKQNVLVCAIILNDISQSNEEDEHDRIIHNAQDAFSITNKYCSLENRKLIGNLILVNTEKDMIDYACGLEHSFNPDVEESDSTDEDSQTDEAGFIENKIDDSVATIFKGEQITLYYLFQKYGRNNEISPEKFHKLKNFAAIANNIDLIIRAALDVTMLPKNAQLLYFNCKSKNASCIQDEILTRDGNGFVIIDISKMQNEEIPEEKQEKYFEEMGINCKSVDEFKLLVHSSCDLESHLSEAEHNCKFTKCDPYRAIADMKSMESHQMGFQRLCTSFISNDNNCLFRAARVGFIINPEKTVFLDASMDDFGIASKDAYSAHCINKIFASYFRSNEQNNIEIESLNMNEVKQRYNKAIEIISDDMLSPSEQYTEVSVANIDVAGIVINGAQEANDDDDVYDVLKEPPIENYIKMKNIPIIRINLNNTEEYEEDSSD